MSSSRHDGVPIMPSPYVGEPAGLLSVGISLVEEVDPIFGFTFYGSSEEPNDAAPSFLLTLVGFLLILRNVRQEGKVS